MRTATTRISRSFYSVPRFRLLVWISLLAWLAASLSGVPTPAQAQGDAPLVLVMTADGPVAPPMVQYVERAIKIAEEDRAEVLIFQINTPGGLLSSMNAMVQVMRASYVPIVVYVTPRGAMAASAGTIITLAGHASAMAPETIIGAASPIGGSGEDLDETAEAKEKNALRATVRTLAAQRGEEAIALAEETIEEARAASAEEALAVGLIDFIAQDLDDLLRQLNGFTVTTAAGEKTLNTSSAQVRTVPPSWIEQALQTLTNPNIVFILINLGIWAILIEISSPGGWAAGTLGVICLALATYGLGILPVNWFGLVFLGLAFALFILDIKAPTHGALTVAGIASLITGGLVLFNNTRMPAFPRISVPLVLAVSLATAASFGVILSFAIRALKAPVRTGQEGVAGKIGVARTEIAPRGSVQLGGELWTAELLDGEESIPAGGRVEVVKMEGITLKVRKAGD